MAFTAPLMTAVSKPKRKPPMAATAAISSARPVVFSFWLVAAAARPCPSVMARHLDESCRGGWLVRFDGGPVRSPGQLERIHFVSSTQRGRHSGARALGKGTPDVGTTRHRRSPGDSPMSADRRAEHPARVLA